MPFPVDGVYIARAAEDLGVRLPLSYIARMQRSNGGDVKAAGDTWQLYPIFDDSDKARIKRTCNDVVRETKLAREWPGFPRDAVAIADNGTGDKLVFVPNDSGDRLAEVVYWWDHATDQLTAVADDFGDLAGR